MKTNTLSKYLLVFIILPVLILKCSKDNDDGDDIENNKDNDSTIVKVLSTISNASNTVLDIAPIPVFKELADLNNDNVDQVLESIAVFNELLKNPQNMPESFDKSAISSSDYDTCVTSFSFTECTFFRDKGDYSMTIKQEIAPTYYTYKIYWSGVFEGVDYGSMYLLQDQFIGYGGMSFYWNFYRPPSPPEFANQEYLSIIYQVYDDATTIFTPWGAVSNRTLYFSSTHSVWDYVLEYNRPSSCSEMVSEGNILALKIWSWSYNKEDLFLLWAASWDFGSHSGSWTSFDENGIPQASGQM